LVSITGYSSSTLYVLRFSGISSSERLVVVASKFNTPRMPGTASSFTR